jgi:hypothetical protein
MMKRMQAFPTWLFLLSFLFLSGCQSTEVTEMPLQIELEVYSGRPNPVWNLDPKETAIFLSRLENVTRATDVTSTPERLGYRGFILKPVGEFGHDWEELSVGFGVIRERKGLKVKYALDEGRVLERWLLESARGKISKDLFAYVLAEVEKI